MEWKILWGGGKVWGKEMGRAGQRAEKYESLRNVDKMLGDVDVLVGLEGEMPPRVLLDVRHHLLGVCT